MGHIDKRTVTLSPEHASLVEKAVDAGEFSSPSEVVGEALREWQERRDNHGYTIAELRRLIQEGIDSGPAVDGPTVMANLRERIRAKAENEVVRRPADEISALASSGGRSQTHHRLYFRTQRRCCGAAA